MSQQVYYIEQWRPYWSGLDVLSFAFYKYDSWSELQEALEFNAGITVCYFRIRIKPVKP